MRQSRAFISFIREVSDLLPPTRYTLIAVGICAACAALGIAIGEFGPPPTKPALADALATC